jgi:hypothetical protein
MLRLPLKLAPLVFLVIVTGIIVIWREFRFLSHFQGQQGEQSKWWENSDRTFPLSNNKKALVCSPIPSTNSTTYKTIWIPGYPGSGSELLRVLVEQVSGGLKAGKRKCIDHPATCKTHCPVIKHCPTSLANKKMSLANYYHPNALLLIRNPRYALPSYVNFIYEAQQRPKGSKLQTHSKQAPVKFWKQIRNDTFTDYLFKGWKQTIVWWVGGGHRHLYNVSLVVPYEQLTNPQQAPILLGEIAKEFMLVQQVKLLEGAYWTSSRLTVD